MATRSQGRRLAERQSPEEFFNAAIKTLAENGAEGLTVNALCARLGVTKGSFYHHFADTDAFVVALMRAWTATLESVIAGLVEQPDPIGQLEDVLVVWQTMPHEAEGAIRAWARTNATVAEAVRRQDALRERVSGEWLAQFVEDPERRRVLAHMGVTMVTGMQERPPPIDREMLVEGCVEFIRMVSGLDIRKAQTPDGPRFRVVYPGL